MPYDLAESVDVTINIYDASGKLVRVLDLGHKESGKYSQKDKAAYWDGTNRAGERVASGLYFYSIQAGDYTATRKMLMIK